MITLGGFGKIPKCWLSRLVFFLPPCAARHAPIYTLNITTSSASHTNEHPARFSRRLLVTQVRSPWALPAVLILMPAIFFAILYGALHSDLESARATGWVTKSQVKKKTYGCFAVGSASAGAGTSRRVASSWGDGSDKASGQAAAALRPGCSHVSMRTPAVTARTAMAQSFWACTGHSAPH